MTTFDFLTDRANLLHTRWAESPKGERPANAIVVAIERFSLTANNFTYVKFGDAFGYWEYFPALPGWGRMPVWGIARVTEAFGNDWTEGERIYGFFPISERLVLLPVSRGNVGFFDAAPHRAKLPPTYNEYVRIDRDPNYDEACADAHLVLRPLFSLAFFLAAWLEEEAFFGAQRGIVSSASSKTAMALADQLQGRIERVGLTSALRRQVVAEGGRFERVIAYPDFEGATELDEGPAVFVDIAGDPAIRRAVHKRLGRMLVKSVGVGATRGGLGPRSIEEEEDLSGPKPEFFFAPTHILRLRELWGKSVLRDRMAASWAEFVRASTGWLRFEISAGRAEIARIYDQVANDAAAADVAAILTAPNCD